MNAMNLVSAKLDRYVRHHILTQPEAKAYSLSSYADAERGGENMVFERALRRVADPAVIKMIRRHQEDEIRHAQIIDDRRRALGLREYAIPVDLRSVDRLSDAAGTDGVGLLDQPLNDDLAVAKIYALLLVIEERAVAEFGTLIPALTRAGDPDTAALFASIAKDEERHLKYCRAVGRLMTGSDEAFAALVEPMRVLEAKVYAQQARQMTHHLMASGLLRLPAPWDGMLRLAIGLANRYDFTGPMAIEVAAFA